MSEQMNQDGIHKNLEINKIMKKTGNSLEQNYFRVIFLLTSFLLD